MADSYVVDTGVFLRWFVDQVTPEEFAGAVRVIDDIGVTVYETTADRLEQAALLSARRMIEMYDALFVYLAQELELPILASDTRLGRADGTGGSSPGSRIRLTDRAREQPFPSTGPC